jgi:hypothetical protein
MRNLVNYLGFEAIDTVPETEVTPEQEREAEALLEEEHRRDEVEYAEAHSEYETKQIAKDEAEALENFCGILTHGLENGEFHRHMAAAVNAYARRFEVAGIPGSESLSLEHHNPSDLEQYYQVSNEFFGKMWQKFKKGLNDRFELSMSKYKETDRDDRRQARAQAMTTKAHALQRRLNELPNGKITLELDGNFRVFTSQGALVRNLDKAAEKDMKSVEFVLKTYVPAVIKWLEGMRSVATQALGAAAISSTGSMGNTKEEVDRFFKNQKYPGEVLTREVLDGSGFINNDRMFYEPHPRRGSDTADIIDSQVNTVPPYMRDTAVKAPKKGTITVTKSELNGLLKVIHQYAKLLSLSSRETRGIMQKLDHDVQLYYPEGTRAPWSGQDEFIVERLMSLLMFAPEFVSEAMNGVYLHIGKVTDGVFDVVEAALTTVQADAE